MQTSIKTTYANVFKPGGVNRPIAAEYSTFSKSWGWYKTIADLSGNQILHFDAVTTLPVTQVFTHLLYCRDKEVADNAQRELDKRLHSFKK